MTPNGDSIAGFCDIEETGDGKWTICFKRPAQEDWLPSALSQFPWLAGLPWLDRRIIFEGKAPNWMYACAAAYAAQGGARCLAVRQMGTANPIAVYPVEIGDFNAQTMPAYGDWWPLDMGGRVLLLRALFGGRRFDPAGLPQLVAGMAGIRDKEWLGIDGPGPGWLYAAFAALAAKHRPKGVLAFYPPADGFIEIYGSQPGAIRSRLPRADTVPGATLGLVGDPNSGKSVLSYVLQEAGRRSGLRVWRYDCDAASPTPPWYVDMASAGEREMGEKVRQSQKREWTHELEQMVAERIRNSRRSLSLLIADLPGGDHRRGKAAQRIPPGREVMMREIDAFAILSPEDRPEARAGWQEALRAHGLADRIVAEWVSAEPDGLPGASRLPDGRWRLCGLSRNRSSSELADAMQGALQPFLQQIIANSQPAGRGPAAAND